MSPANIEAKLKAASPLIAQVVAIGDRRPYNVALITLDLETLAARGAAAEDEEIAEEIAAAVAAGNERLSRVEQIKRYAVIAGEWEPGGEELTPTLKLKRRPIERKYEAEIRRYTPELEGPVGINRRLLRYASGAAAMRTFGAARRESDCDAR